MDISDEQSNRGPRYNRAQRLYTNLVKQLNRELLGSENRKVLAAFFTRVLPLTDGYQLDKVDTLILGHELFGTTSTRSHLAELRQKGKLTTRVTDEKAWNIVELAANVDDGIQRIRHKVQPIIDKLIPARDEYFTLLSDRPDHLAADQQEVMLGHSR